MVRLTAFAAGFMVLVLAWAVWPTTGAAISNGVAAPDVSGENWLNSKPLTIGALRDRVVLVEFWTYG